jgi:hypothetical protein
VIELFLCRRFSEHFGLGGFETLHEADSRLSTRSTRAELSALSVDGRGSRRG